MVLGEAVSWGGGGVWLAAIHSCFVPEGLVISLPSGCDSYRLFHFDCMLCARPTNVLKLNDHNLEIYQRS